MKFIIYITLTLITSVSFAHDTNHGVQLDKITNKALSRNAITTISPDGQMSLDTKNSYRSVTLTRVNKEGKIETFCTTNEKNAKKFLKGKPLKEIEGVQK